MCRPSGDQAGRIPCFAIRRSPVPSVRTSSRWGGALEQLERAESRERRHAAHMGFCRWLQRA
jgi:hypothetical protein